MTKNDKLLILIVLIVSLISFAGYHIYSSTKTEGTTAIIKSKGKIVKQIKLSSIKKPVTFIVNGSKGETIVVVDSNGIKIKDSACRDKICVHRGYIKHKGESIICIPNQIVIEVNENKDGLDGITE